MFDSLIRHHKLFRTIPIKTIILVIFILLYCFQIVYSRSDSNLAGLFPYTEQKSEKFNLIDRNGDGYLTRSEVAYYINAVYGATSTRLRRIINKIFEQEDTNHDGVISWREFFSPKEDDGNPHDSRDHRPRRRPRPPRRERPERAIEPRPRPVRPTYVDGIYVPPSSRPEEAPHRRHREVRLHRPSPEQENPIYREPMGSVRFPSRF